MATKKNNEGRGQRSKTPGQTSASDPNPTATSPSAFAPTGDTTTASLLPLSASPFALPTTTTIQLIPSAPPPTTSLLPSSPSQITATTLPLPSAAPLPIPKTHQDRISCTSYAATTTDLASPSTAPSASAASTDDFMSLFATAVLEAFGSVEALKNTVMAAEMMLAERKKRDGSGGSCGGSEGASSGTDSDSGESDGEGGGVGV
uniref:Glycoprotein gp100-like n=1 Tax=Elaeis guineensis var. tenera TaxID=51953 RepID=A0A6I9RZY2_ELAGV|nr:glycoprotein gp100-like [Elaeis guineensis]